MISPTDITVSLSRLARFNGHTTKPYYVAQHSIIVSQMVKNAGADPKLQLAALLHDAHEAYISDIPSPVKWSMGSGLEGLKEIERGIDRAVSEAFGFDQELFYHPLVKQADGSALKHEKEALLKDHGHNWDWDEILGGIDILPPPKNLSLEYPMSSESSAYVMDSEIASIVLECVLHCK